ncbi:aminotransferase class V-fold PLP-dependent enzyme [Blautia liquoris]|uniref:cysteine desulfurase n=1 Tax=Blautia liquoris TaxID=2779518 RepID=A0A7M2RE79_9FIRM|nr:aminotransferase class V-fold PLP-dependent enzyme [Blautia liquoris]QOV18274.1 aminotransferase class V-fold PLP-dependent enzyme [Blautia liquoris]
MIYLDSAATSFYRPPQVAEAVAQAIRHMGNSSRGAYEISLETSRIIYQTRCLIDELFSGEGPEQTAFTMNSTESLNTAIKGLLSPGDTAVTTVLEHNSVLRPLYEMEERGVKLEIIGCDNHGVLDYKAMKEAIERRPKLAVCTHASNLCGNLTDIRRIGSWCAKSKVLFVVDASQTAGIFPIDMQKDHIDVLCFTGHKSLMGPQGTGGLCVKKDVQIRPLLSGGSGIQTYSKTHPNEMPAALEAGTMNGHGIAGLQAALLYLKEQKTDMLREKEQDLAWDFYSQVKKIPDVHIYGDFSSKNRAPIVTLNLGDEDSGAVSDFLAEECEIYTRSGGHCAPLLHQRFRTEDQGSVRFSFSHYNTQADVDAAVKGLRCY